MEKLIALFLSVTCALGSIGCTRDSGGDVSVASVNIPVSNEDNNTSADLSSVSRSEVKEVVGSDIEKPNLTISALKDLIESHGENLALVDFDSYHGDDVGSGLYIVHYPINEDYYLMIGSGSREEPPIYIRLISVNTGDYIDVRTESIDEFINN